MADASQCYCVTPMATPVTAESETSLGGRKSRRYGGTKRKSRRHGGAKRKSRRYGGTKRKSRRYGKAKRKRYLGGGLIEELKNDIRDLEVDLLDKLRDRENYEHENGIIDKEMWGIRNKEVEAIRRQIADKTRAIAILKSRGEK